MRLPHRKKLLICMKTMRNVKRKGLKVETGQFQAKMKVKVDNDGPVTILLDSKKHF